MAQRNIRLSHLPRQEALAKLLRDLRHERDATPALMNALLGPMVVYPGMNFSMWLALGCKNEESGWMSIDIGEVGWTSRCSSGEPTRYTSKDILAFRVGLIEALRSMFAEVDVTESQEAFAIRYADWFPSQCAELMVNAHLGNGVTEEPDGRLRAIRDEEESR